MPSVPRANPSQVSSLKPLPDAKVSGGATAETFGGGASAKEVSTALQGFNDAAVKLAISHQTDMDKTYVASQDPLLVKIKNETRSNIDRNYGLAKSIEAPDEANSYFDRTQSIIDSAPNEWTKNKLIKARSVYANELSSHAEAHMTVESKKYQAVTYDSSLETNSQDAANNYDKPEVIMRSRWKNGEATRTIADQAGIPHDSVLFKDMMQKANTNLHESVINAMVTNNDPGKARAYFDSHKKEIEPNKAKQLDSAIGQEIDEAIIDTTANRIMGLGDDVPGILKEIEKEPAKTQTKVRQAVEYKMKIRSATRNVNESDISVALAKGEITKSTQLDMDPRETDPEFRVLATQWLGAKYETERKGKQRTAYKKLVDQYSNIQDDDLYAKNKKLADFRKDILRNKGALTKAQSDDFLQWSTPGYRAKMIEPKPGLIERGLKLMVSTYGAMTNFSGYVAEYMQKAGSANAKDVPGHTRDAMNQLAQANHENQQMIPNPTNYEHGGGSVKSVLPIKSDAKHDVTVPTNRILVTRRDTGKKVTIPRDKFDNATYKKEQ